MVQSQGSPAFSLNGVDWQKIGTGAAVALGGALLTYVADSVLPEMQEKEVISAALFVLFSTGINALRKFLMDTSR
jgi:hypothetical protein